MEVDGKMLPPVEEPCSSQGSQGSLLLTLLLVFVPPKRVMTGYLTCLSRLSPAGVSTPPPNPRPQSRPQTRHPKPGTRRSPVSVGLRRSGTSSAGGITWGSDARDGPKLFGASMGKHLSRAVKELRHHVKPAVKKRFVHFLVVGKTPLLAQPVHR